MLTQEKTNKHTYISRYNGFKIYYNSNDGKYCNGRTAWLKKQQSYILYVTEKGDTWDNLSLKFYGNPTYYWVILDGNRLLDPFDSVPIGVQIKIPVLSDIEFMKGERE